MNYDKLAKKFDGEVDYDAVAEETVMPPPQPQPRAEYQPPAINRPAAPAPGFFFPARQAAYHRSQVEDMQAKTDLIIAQEGAAAKMEMSARATDDALRMQPTRLAEINAVSAAAHEAAMQNHSLTVAQAKATELLIHRALDRGLDTVTYGAVRLEEENLHTEISKARQLTDIELDKHKQLSEIELEKRGSQIQQDIRAALIVNIAPKHQILHMQEEVMKLLEQAHKVRTGTEPEELKTAKLEVLEETITRWRQELRGLLQGDNQKGLERGDQDTDG
jgi:hypothetical protein